MVPDPLTRMIDASPAAWQVRLHGALNSLAGMSAFVRRRSEGQGLSGDLDRVAATLDSFAGALDATGSLGEPGNVLELGPGRTPHVAAAFALCGARSVVGLDATAQIDTGKAARVGGYASLARHLASEGGRCFAAALGASPSDVLGRLEGDEPLPVVFAACDGQHLALPSGSVDLLVSRSVLEHVRLGGLGVLLREAHRVLKPGGRMVHWIDLRDHFYLLGDVEADGDWLHGLRFAQDAYDRMFSNRPVYVNRLRSSQWREAFRAAGFEEASWRETRLALPEGFDAASLHAPWNETSEDELSVAILECVLVRPPSPRSA